MKQMRAALNTKTTSVYIFSQTNSDNPGLPYPVDSSRPPKQIHPCLNVTIKHNYAQTGSIPALLWNFLRTCFIYYSFSRQALCKVVSVYCTSFVVSCDIMDRLFTVEGNDKKVVIKWVVDIQMVILWDKYSFNITFK